MELEGLKRGLSHLKEYGITVDGLVTDRHLPTRKHMREEEKQTDHRVDMWHTSKGIYITNNLIIFLKCTVVEMLQ